MRSHCHFCRREVSGRADHDHACPDFFPSNSKERRQALAGNRLGWMSGRAGGTPEHTFKPGPGLGLDAWELGSLGGTIALEAAENGYDPRFDD